MRWLECASMILQLVAFLIGIQAMRRGDVRRQTITVDHLTFLSNESNATNISTNLFAKNLIAEFGGDFSAASFTEVDELKEVVNNTVAGSMPPMEVSQDHVGFLELEESEHAVFLELEVVPCGIVCDDTACRADTDQRKDSVTRACLPFTSNGSAAAKCERLEGDEKKCCQCLEEHPEEISVTCHHMQTFCEGKACRAATVTRACLPFTSNGSAAAKCESLEGEEKNCCQCLETHPEEISATCHPQMANSQQILDEELSFQNVRHTSKRFVAHTRRILEGRLILTHAFAEENFWSSDCIQLTKGDMDLGDALIHVTFISTNVMRIYLRFKPNFDEVRTKLEQHQEKTAAELTDVAKMIMSGKKVIDEEMIMSEEKVNDEEGGPATKEFWLMMQNMSNVDKEVWYSQERKVEVVCKKLEKLIPNDAQPRTKMWLFKLLLQNIRMLAGMDWIYFAGEESKLRSKMKLLRRSCRIQGKYDPCAWVWGFYKLRQNLHRNVRAKLDLMATKMKPLQPLDVGPTSFLQNPAASSDRPAKVAIVGGGPIGLFAAFSAALAFLAESHAYAIDVFEMRVDFYRGNGLTLWPATAKFLVDLGWKELMPRRSLKFVRDEQNRVGTRAAQIAATQRFFWRLGLFLGVRTHFRATFLAVCHRDDKRWEALVAPTRCGIGQLDEMGSCWLKTPRYDTADDGLCETPPQGSRKFQFDVLVGADGTRSTTRALIPGVGWQEDATPRFYGMTFTYHPSNGQSCTPLSTSRRALNGIRKGKIKLVAPYELAPYCYTSVVLSQTEGELVKKYSTKRLQWWINRYFQVHPSRLNIQPNGKPDIAFLKVKLASASQIGGGGTESPPILLVGDSYAPGFYFLGNGFNGGIARLQKPLWEVGHIPAFVRAVHGNKTQDFIRKYTEALGCWDDGGVGTSETQRNWNRDIAVSLMKDNSILNLEFFLNQRAYLKAKKKVDKACQAFTQSHYDFPP